MIPSESGVSGIISMSLRNSMDSCIVMGRPVSCRQLRLAPGDASGFARPRSREPGEPPRVEVTVNGFLLVSVKCRLQRPRADGGRCAGLGSCDSQASGAGVDPRSQPYKAGTVGDALSGGHARPGRRHRPGHRAHAPPPERDGRDRADAHHPRRGYRRDRSSLPRGLRLGSSRHCFPITDRRTPSVSCPSLRRHPSEEPAAPGRHGHAPWKSCAPAPTAVPVNSQLYSAGGCYAGRVQSALLDSG
jgi:hypothetical protein